MSWLGSMGRKSRAGAESGVQDWVPSSYRHSQSQAPPAQLALAGYGREYLMTKGRGGRDHRAGSFHTEAGAESTWRPRREAGEGSWGVGWGAELSTGGGSQPHLRAGGLRSPGYR